MLNRKQIFDALTDDGKIDVAGTEAQRIINRLMDLQSQHDGKPIVSGSLPSDEDIEKYFSWGYGGDAGSAIFGAKWLKKEILLGGNDR